MPLDPLLVVRDLQVAYETPQGRLHAVKGASLEVAEGRIFGLVGESGSGKSTMALAIMGALGREAVVRGEVRYRGEDLLRKPEAQLRRLWGRRLAIVFQNAGSTLNPVLPVGDQIIEVLREHERCSRAEARDRMLDLLEAVRLPNPAAMARRYAHQLSGGQQQRVTIAIAMACSPELLVLDEPTTGLDVTTEAHILDLVESLRQRTRTTILYISHNLALVGQLCDEIAVLYAGEIVELGPTAAVFSRPRHPYAAALLACLPDVARARSGRLLPAIGGSLPDPRTEPTACQFAARCRIAEERCRTDRPPLVTVGPGHASRCFFWDRLSLSRGDPGFVKPQPDAGRPVPQPLLEVVRLTHAYSPRRRLADYLASTGRVLALNGVSLEVGRGEIVGVVGESGSGKTTLARCLVGLLAPDAGEIRIDGEALPGRPSAWPRSLRRRLQIVFQNPDLTLNPRRTVLEAIARPLKLFGLADARSRPAVVRDLLHAVRLADRYGDALPHELSGGERQRVSIARALASRPEVVIADEPTSALDVSVQAAVLNLLVDLQRAHELSYVFISHDLSVIRYLADRVVVMYLGGIVHAGPTEAVFTPPYHPYTEALLAALPRFGPRIGRPAVRLEGPPPDPASPPSGCRLHPRCPRKIGPICEEQVPSPIAYADGEVIACHIPGPELLRLQTGRGEAARLGGGHGPH